MEQFERIKGGLPAERGNVRITSQTFLSVMLPTIPGH